MTQIPQVEAVETVEVTQNGNGTQLLNSSPQELIEQATDMKNKLAVLHGLYVVIRMATEERLTLRFENLNRTQWEELSEFAEDYMRRVDDKYRLRTNRGRSWKGTGYRKIKIAAPATTDPTIAAMMETVDNPNGNSTRTFRFSPFPSSLLNMFKTLRKMRADTYRRHCIVLQRQEESFESNINILPYANAPEFAMDLQEINAKIQEANKTIEAFIETEDWQYLKENLEPYGISDYLETHRWQVEECSLMTTEIALETAQVKQHIEEEYRKMFHTIDKEKAKAIEAVHQEFEKGQRSIAEAALASLQTELTNMVKRVVSSSKRKPERVKADLERLRRKIVSIGLDALEPTVNQLETIFDEPEKAIEIFGTTDVESAVSERVQGLIDSL